LTVHWEVLSTAANALMLALMDAGIPMKELGCASTCIIDPNGQFILDPNRLELEVRRKVLFFRQREPFTSLPLMPKNPSLATNPSEHLLMKKYDLNELIC
jgi:hypothetical protein